MQEEEGGWVDYITVSSVSTSGKRERAGRDLHSRINKEFHLSLFSSYHLKMDFYILWIEFLHF